MSCLQECRWVLLCSLANHHQRGPQRNIEGLLRWSDCNIELCVYVSARVDDHGLYNLVSSITDAGIPAYLKSLVNGADAEKAYAGFLEFRVVVTVPWIL